MAFSVAQRPPVKASGKQFIEFLIARGRIRPGFRSVLRNRDLPQVNQYLISKNLVGKEELQKLYADYYGLPYITLSDTPLRKEVINFIPEEVARKYQVIAYGLNGKDINIAIGRPAMLQQTAPGALLKLRQQKGLDIHLAITEPAQVRAVIDKAYGSRPLPDLGQLKTSKDEKKEDQEHHRQSAPVKALNKRDLIKEVDPRQKTVDLTSLKVPPEILARIPFQVAKKYKIIVFGSNMHRGKYEPPLIQIGVVNPDNFHTKEILAYIAQKNKVLVDSYLITEDSWRAALDRYPKTSERTGDIKVAPEAKIKTDAEPIRPKSKSIPSISPPPAVPPPKKIEPSPGPKTEKILKPAETDIARPAISVSTIPSEGLVLSEGDIINKPSNETDIKDSDAENPFADQDLDKLLKSPVESPQALAEVIKRGVIPEIISALLFLAIRMKASDIHIESQKKIVRFRYRIDGILHDIISTPHFMHAPLISRIKILSKMKIDEQRVPQDGRFDVIINKRQVDLRVSTLPTIYGEKIVMRLLDKSSALRSLEQLGVTESNFDKLIESIDKPYGIILSTGPTGSGKTTTLYAILNRISKPGVNIVTLEDPVEYELPGVNQSQVMPQIGFSFAEGLRSVLRQDPNIIMVGEIRDLETAAMATHSALTGHLVLSTLHTNDATGALPRLINMGVEPFLITSSINAVVGQRLVRKVCDNCREKAEIPPAVKTYVKGELARIPSGQLKELDLEQLVFYKGGGCDNCTNGYSGRIGIFEVMVMSGQIEDLAIKKAPASEIREAAVKDGMITMLQDGLVKALKGITTVDEVMRVTTSSIKDAPQE